MQIFKAEIIKTRREHRKTKYRIIYHGKTGFWIFTRFKHYTDNFQFDTCEQAHRYIVRTHPGIKTITIGK